MKHRGAFHLRARAVLCAVTCLPFAAAWAATPASAPAAASMPVATMPPIKPSVPGVTGAGFNLVELLQELKGNNPQLIQGWSDPLGLDRAAVRE